MKTVDVIPFRLDADVFVPLDLAWKTLSPEEVQRAMRFHFDRDRLRFVRGRAGLRSLLAECLSVVDPASLRLVSGPKGKPFLPDAPRLHFNLSHSGDDAVLALGTSGSLGIDLERLDRQIDPLALGAQVFTSSELESLRAVSGIARHRRFFAFWTAKEAVMKLTGEGLHLEPREVALALAASGRPISAGICRRGAAYSLAPVDLGDADLACTLAAKVGVDVRVRRVGRHLSERVAACE